MALRSRESRSRRRWSFQRRPEPGWFDRELVMGIVVMLAVFAAALMVQAWLRHRAPGPEQAAAAQVDLASFSVFVHHQGCAGHCPVYALLAKGTGTVDYEGVESVATVGSAHAPLDELQVRALVGSMLRSGIMQSAPVIKPGAAQCAKWDYGQEILKLGATVGGRTYTVDYYPGCKPGVPALATFAREVEAIVDSARWVQAQATP